MYSADPLILELLALLKAHGVRHIVISPGSRHYPAVRSLEADGGFSLYSVVDERSAAFFAMGVIRATGQPTAVMTTSGTAAVNLASAVADAYYQRLPLVAITADRLPQLLDQMEDQMVDQVHLFTGMLRGRALLRAVTADIDRWYNNRVLNEALLSMRTNGSGPIHINFPVRSHSGLSYDTAALPAARVISRHTSASGQIDWDGVRDRLRERRVMLLWGQGDPIDPETLAALDRFTAFTNSLIVADHLSNLHHPACLARPYASLGSGKARGGALVPDIVITVGGTLFLIEEVKSLLQSVEFEHWRVDPDGQVADPFWQLTDVFQVSAMEFLDVASLDAEPLRRHEYREVALEVSLSVPVPEQTYGELSTVGKLIERLPPESTFLIGNSSPMRMAHLFEIDPSVTVLANRGVNGINGSMSSAVGYAAASGRLSFLIVGDLSFFYDMNALSIRHRPPNLRILVVNNGGGALMHAAPVPAEPQLQDQAAVHTSAGHSTSARGWAESVGMRYLSAMDSDTLESALDDFVRTGVGEAVLLEVFSEKKVDMRQMAGYWEQTLTPATRVYRNMRAMAGNALRCLGLYEHARATKRKFSPR